MPPLSQRLKPLIPFLIWWTIITSLIVHILRTRKSSEAELDRAYAQESVLRGIRDRLEAGEDLSDAEIRRELEMVGLRERTLATAHLAAELGELRNVGWWEVMLGRKRGEAVEEAIEGEVKSEEKSEEEAVEQWSKSELPASGRVHGCACRFISAVAAARAFVPNPSCTPGHRADQQSSRRRQPSPRPRRSTSTCQRSAAEQQSGRPPLPFTCSPLEPTYLRSSDRSGWIGYCIDEGLIGLLSLTVPLS